MIEELKKELSKSFEMKGLRQARQILGMQILRDRKTKRLWLSQQKYTKRVLEWFNMKDAKPVNTPLANYFILIIENEMIKIKKIHTDDNPSDMMTKVIPKEKFELCTELAGMKYC
ncbi:hypothetical protein RJ640_010258 [Escallonia rubra]|uniref:Reverse transcriptase Ty1/copia-type domain-containing protein n=1 Tax=Escallonia rubra TaxID=112253 RepID=A0AA88QYZ6_9ASTE|nr:hypothetical protein RJ640_010258 [Escallonia rubra]